MKVTLTNDELDISISCLIYVRERVEENIGGCVKGPGPLHTLVVSITNSRIDAILGKLHRARHPLKEVKQQA